jgi:putative N6-adenine-specific DNA methylase
MRVLLELSSFNGSDSDALYEGVRAIPWADWMTVRHTFAVQGTGRSESLRHTGFIALRAKDAIADAMRMHSGSRPNVDAHHPDVPVMIHVGKTSIRVHLDLCGESLHRRGYRPRNAPAPLKETLAATLLIWAGYNGEHPFCDPMAGTGTLVVEAAWIARHRAPGLGRHFAFERWPIFAGALQSQWHRMLHETRQQERTTGLAEIVGRDWMDEPLALMNESITHAGLTGHVRTERGDVRRLTLPSQGGTVVTNPPYGERLGKPLQILGLYRGFGEAASRWSGWSVHVLSGQEGFERAFGHKVLERRHLFNGTLRCQFLGFRPGGQVSENSN